MKAIMNITTRKKLFPLQKMAVVVLFFTMTSFIVSDNEVSQTAEHSLENGMSKDFSTCGIHNSAFAAGEEITHKLFYNLNFIWLGAGTSTATVTDFDDDHHLIDIKGTTLKSFDWFYKIKDHYTSTIDKKTLVPSTCMRYIEEGKYTLYDKVDFNKKEHKATSTRGKTEKIARTTTYDYEGCMHDLVSMVYYLRNVDFKKLEKGDELPMQIFMDRKAWNIQVRYEGRKVVKVKGKGRYLVNKVTTRMSDGELFDENSYISVYISTDKNQIPILVKLELAIGSVQVVLSDYKNLKHPFSDTYKEK